MQTLTFSASPLNPVFGQERSSKLNVPIEGIDNFTVIVPRDQLQNTRPQRHVTYTSCNDSVALWYSVSAIDLDDRLPCLKAL